MTKTLRVAVIGAGRMGADHIKRLSTRIHGAEVAAVVDVDLARAQAAIEGIDRAVALASADEALNNGDVNAVLIATPGFLHEEILYKALEKDFPILCEKPLTPDAGSAWKVVQAEQALGHKRIQVGFMRRFDAEYSALGAIIRNSELGELLMLHHQHRNPSTPEGFTNEMLINDSVVHEFDAIRFFTGEEITSVQVRLGKPTRSAPSGQHDPQHVLLETESGVLADVEIYVNAKFGYQVATQASFEEGIVSIGSDNGPYVQTAGKWGGNVTPGFEERFGAAYDVEVQAWVDAALRGEIGGPTAWDGYATAACCEAGVEAQKSGEKVKVQLNTKPDLYK
ncbi:Gfo/Idh/MocA family oxidoreductase [Arthrobacter sp. Rue61a]|uniref:Inositol 2-dehydrogenase 1 n=1 Tax=Paenarthrobacter aurescens (strain TC1) TaxID=290340 RepID=IOLG1_PAEAT|nr:MULTISPECIES: Gfo/Idh/MocA family oxidoreductase [Micrococcaceae]A1R665.1 RecName: Full=Inositol 2-dehydrogenase 1; AltName: Full=Myo-inositol 2-dehydrogenase 1; Short=MI 2-dehydrogenase 1 [Paenarthrobacter aurescens TC1]ABM08500.1 putative myo-inositol dehydrogenase [Paenarthrobacter aurescens TC1]AFR29039.1 inositol 2-dehydrogenase [Arthrobacter sp. Rue61a]